MEKVVDVVHHEDNPMKIELKKIDRMLPKGDSILLIGLGFDKRSLSILNSIHLNAVELVLGIHNGGWVSQSDNNVHEFNQICGSKGVMVGERCTNAIQVIDTLFEKLKPLVDSGRALNYLIDATGFSHELLAIVIGLLNNMALLSNIHILYTGAAQYSTNTPSTHKWLSRGVVEVRSILGFPGEMLPSKKLHLVIMAGFEVERAAEVIARYEPAALSIGVGAKEHSVSMEHHEYNTQAHQEILALVQRMRGINCDIYEFEFSCIDPMLVKKQILEHVSHYSEFNVVVCPLNTKLSTVGAALAAIENQKIQLCYSQPREYNIEGYAYAGDVATIIRLS